MNRTAERQQPAGEQWRAGIGRDSRLAGAGAASGGPTSRRW